MCVCMCVFTYQFSSIHFLKNKYVEIISLNKQKSKFLDVGDGYIVLRLT